MTLADSDAALDAFVVEGFALDRDHAREILEGRETSTQDHQTVSGSSAEVSPSQRRDNLIAEQALSPPLDDWRIKAIRVEPGEAEWLTVRECRLVEA